MKTSYTLLLFCFPFLLVAQQKVEQRISVGIGQAHLHLLTTESYEVHSTGSFRSWSSSMDVSSARAVGINLGYHLQVSPRWELTGRINYSGNKLTEPIHDHYNSVVLNSPLNTYYERHRTYRALWSEALLFWRVVGERSLVDLQLGTGIAHLYYFQEYNSGYIYNAQLQQFDSRQTTIERKGSFGLPIQFQAQYPINYHWKIGATAQVNAFYKGSQQTGLLAFVAYRW